VEPGRPPDGQRRLPSIPSRLLQALASLAPEALRDVGDAIVLHRDFPAWAVWLPDGRHRWIAVRPASARPAAPEVPMIWVKSKTAADLVDRMRATDAQLAVRPDHQ